MQIKKYKLITNQFIKTSHVCGVDGESDLTLISNEQLDVVSVLVVK